MISNLVGTVPEGSWIDRKVELCHVDHATRTLPQFRLAAA